MRYRERKSPSITASLVRNMQTDILSSTTTLPCKTTSTSVDYSATQTVPGKSETMLDVVHPGFKKKSKRGLIFNSPMTKIVVETETPVIHGLYEHHKYRWMRNAQNVYSENWFQTTKISGPMPFAVAFLGVPSFLPLPPFSDDLESLKARAITEAFSKISDSDLLIGACLLEAKSTASMLLSNARKVLKILKAIRKPRIPRINKKSLRSAARESADIYMTARYGLRPLYYDILGAMKITSSDPYRYRNTTRGWKSNSHVNNDKIVKGTSAGWINAPVGGTLTINRESSSSFDVRAGVLCDALEATLWRRIGVSLIAETAWDLTPFSFILDWFGNFGSLISSWAPKPGVNVRASWVTVTQRQLQEIHCRVEAREPYLATSPYTLGAITRSFESIDGFVGTQRFSTTVTTRIPNPGRPFLPRIEVNMDLPKTLDLAIIGNNIYKKCLRIKADLI